MPPYVRKSACVSVALPWLYLRGISTGDMSEALGIMLGGEIAGMSPNTVRRLKAQWADDIHTGVRSDDSDGQCLLVIIGVTPEGEKERVAIGAGYRELKELWCELLLNLKKRGLSVARVRRRRNGLLVSDGESVLPHTHHHLSE